MNAIDERIGELVRSHREELERLVDQALERELAQLVAERLAARNGAKVEARQAVSAPAVERLCRVCGERQPAKHRTVCEKCRHRPREPETPAQEPPHPAEAANA